jgi:hypothetical protein
METHLFSLFCFGNKIGIKLTEIFNKLSREDAIVAFNSNPKKVHFFFLLFCFCFSLFVVCSISLLQGIKLLQEGNYVENTVQGIANFLFNEKSLRKLAIGEYLGGK